MSFAKFSMMPTSVNLFGVGVVNGYKLTAILHSGRNVSLSTNQYFYVPHARQLVSYRGSHAKPMKISAQGKYNLQEKLPQRGVVPFKIDAADLHSTAHTLFG